MNSLAPRISVVIPLYNQSDSIRRTLESVLAQSFEDFEVLVVDDGSTDAGGDVVSGLEYARVQLIHQENSGVSAARNRGISEARGKIVAFLDADDEWYPDYLENIVSLADRYPECGVYATSYVARDAEGVEQVPLMRDFPSVVDAFVFENYFAAASVSSPPLWTGTVSAAKSALDGVGGFPVEIASGEDLLTWARLFSLNGVAYLPLPKGVYVKESLSWKHVSRVPEVGDPVGVGLRAIWLDAEVPAIKKVGLRRYLGLWKKIRASHFIALGMRIDALKTVAASIFYSPFNVKVWLYIPFLCLPSALRDFLVGVVEKSVDPERGRI
ncbi:glycosyltransferase family 2 protein [bacterium AH-315-P07]|nr:glycosyltransferase family 2 protein [bacterium AH-315-P07]